MSLNSPVKSMPKLRYVAILLMLGVPFGLMLNLSMTWLISSIEYPDFEMLPPEWRPPPEALPLPFHLQKANPFALLLLNLMAGIVLTHFALTMREAYLEGKRKRNVAHRSASPPAS
ncbi:hypothetical protein B6U84_04075 [Candidatus Bathyarchaeota archaeon ex4484_40]|nr:MAG: hypothetical protein B6U84_04075 [Candidatus Bathyarchaeota archaeon ex4484_40]